MNTLIVPKLLHFNLVTFITFIRFIRLFQSNFRVINKKIVFGDAKSSSKKAVVNSN